MAKNIKLYEYQTRAVARVFAAWDNGLSSVLLQSPTGSGKTVMSTEIISLWLAKHPTGRVFFLIHTDLLRNSTAATFAALLQHLPNAAINIVDGQHPRLGAKIHVVTYQKLNRHIFSEHNYKKYFDAGPILVVADEAHIGYSDAILSMLAGLIPPKAPKGYEPKKYENAQVLGMTATPKRPQNSKVKLHNLYDIKFVVTTPVQLVQDKKLAPIRVIYPAGSISREEIMSIPQKKVNGESDFDPHAASQFMQQKKKLYDGFEALFVELKQPKTLVFCTDIEHVLTTTQKFLDAGIRARFLTSDVTMPDPDSAGFSQKLEKWRKFETLKQAGHTDARQRLLAGWGKDFDVLVSADILTTGVDVPDIMCVAIIRPTLSENLYLQMVGRLTRYLPDKLGIFIDLAGLIAMHGHPYLERDYPLRMPPKKAKKDGVPPTKQCPMCGGILPASARVCSHTIMAIFDQPLRICGYEFPMQKRVPIDTDFSEFDWSEVLSLAPTKAATKLNSPTAIYEYWRQKNAAGDKIKYAWVFYRIFEEFGKNGIIEVSLHIGIPPLQMLAELEANTNIRF